MCTQAGSGGPCLAGAAKAVPEGVARGALVLGGLHAVARRAAEAVAQQRRQAIPPRLGGRPALGRRLHLVRLAVVAVRQLRACTQRVLSAAECTLQLNVSFSCAERSPDSAVALLCAQAAAGVIADTKQRNCLCAAEERWVWDR